MHAIIISALFLLAASFTNEPIKTGPQIQVDSQIIDLGVIGLTEKISREIVIRNVGDAPLLIKRVETSCGCTVSEVKQKLITARSSTMLTIDFDASKKGPGKVTSFVSVSSNSNDQEELLIEIRALVIEEIPGERLRSVGSTTEH